MINLKRALVDPASIFKRPQDVLIETTLTREQKINILRRWEYDMREILVAEEENMQGKDVLVTLEQILQALQSLDAGDEGEESAPTKQGG